MQKRNRVVITGLGVLAANGTGVKQFWDTLCRGESGIGPVTLCDVTDLPCKIAGEVKNFRPEDYLDGKIKPKRLSRTSQFAVAAAKMAVEDAGLDLRGMRKNYPIPLRIGISMGGLDYLESQIVKIPTKGARFISPSIIGCVDTATAIAVAEILEFEAELKTLSTTCVAGMDAISDAAKTIREGKAEIAIAGAADAAIETSMMASLSAARMLPSFTGDPKNASRPFDLKRCGGILSEGSGFVVLERMEHALARKAVPYTEFIASGSGTDMGNNAGSGLEVSMQTALANAGWLPETIDAIYAHAPSDIDIDFNEVQALKSIFVSQAVEIPTTSIKGATGNPLSVGGAHQVIASSLGFRNGQIPPTANYEYPDPRCNLSIVHDRPAKILAKCVLLNAHGIGKVNSSVLLKKFEI